MRTDTRKLFWWRCARGERPGTHTLFFYAGMGTLLAGCLAMNPCAVSGSETAAPAPAAPVTAGAPAEASCSVHPGTSAVAKVRGKAKRPRGTNAPPADTQATNATYQMQFEDADIREVVRLLATITGETILPDPQLTGKVTIISPAPVTADEARRIILSALEVQGFTIVRVGAVTKIMPSAKAARAPIPTVVTDDR